MLEEYDWTSFSVVTTRHHGYEDFLAMVEGMTDGSFIGWERKSVVILNVTDDPGGARTKRLLKDNEAQVRLETQMSFPAAHIHEKGFIYLMVNKKEKKIQRNIFNERYLYHLPLILMSCQP